ncbi:hypothetical protein RQP53_17050 [Paucibacter sp. APW11]|uniref:Lipoprotein n=1 Tax=Roseateles aquae TaxID=3077235 RepID=A0ABU3PFX2_9BURK|nr:hypothetical protein [Paucibacter sp. APW11]MDT9000988.1 hypothetical protein [Paucibacter sp. APW11]
MSMGKTGLTAKAQLCVQRAAVLFALALVACGGGGTGTAVTESPAGSTCKNARIQASTTAQVGRNAELSVLGCAGAALSQLQWRQTAGPALTLMSARSQAISIEPTEAGSYRFEVGYVDAAGALGSSTIDLSVAPAPAAPALIVRGEPSVWSGGQLSLRAWMPGLSEAERSSASVQWSVLSGPSTTLAEAKSWRLIFSAPQVTQDSLLQLRVAVTLADGRSASQDFGLLVQAVAAPVSGALFGSSNPSSRVYAYRADSPHAGALAACIYHPALSGSTVCPLSRLPLLGQEAGAVAPSVEQVMNRVLVSNDWMGEVFENFLRTQDANGDFRRMLAATTAVVIGGRVRPAFYWSYTGAIYLDADFLWLTATQRDSISEVPDPRSDYGSELGFTTLWRYVKNNQYAGGSYPVQQRGNRDISQLSYTLGRLLYHELSHAGDFVPPRVHQVLRSDLPVWQAGPAFTPSNDLQQRLPFFSQDMVGLGQVQFFGQPASAAQRAWTPVDITAFFSSDRVNDDYSYSLPVGATVPREDAAMLVEEAMMQLRYGVMRDFAITLPLAKGASSADLLVHWGQRGRIGEAALRPRVDLVLGQILPWLQADFSAGLAPAQALRAGLSWGVNLDQAALAAGQARGLTATERQIEAEQASRRGGEQARRQRAQTLQHGATSF